MAEKSASASAKIDFWGGILLGVFCVAAAALVIGTAYLLTQ